MANKIETHDIKHNPINVLLTIENGKVIHSRTLHSSEFAASWESWIWMAEKAGYQIISPADRAKDKK